MLFAFLLMGKRHELGDALRSASFLTLSAGVVLQVIALLSRTEAWRVCVTAAGGSVGRRRLYRASSMGYVGSLVNAQLGAAARITALRRSSPSDSPAVAPLIAAELPIMAVEATPRALASVTLVGPPGLPWWSPLLALPPLLLLSTRLRALALRGGGRGRGRSGGATQRAGPRRRSLLRGMGRGRPSLVRRCGAAGVVGSRAREGFGKPAGGAPISERMVQLPQT